VNAFAGCATKGWSNAPGRVPERAAKSNTVRVRTPCRQLRYTFADAGGSDSRTRPKSSKIEGSRRAVRPWGVVGPWNLSRAASTKIELLVATRRYRSGPCSPASRAHVRGRVLHAQTCRHPGGHLAPGEPSSRRPRQPAAPRTPTSAPSIGTGEAPPTKLDAQADGATLRHS
jgi:hypothetical protein